MPPIETNEIYNTMGESRPTRTVRERGILPKYIIIYGWYTLLSRQGGMHRLLSSNNILQGVYTPAGYILIYERYAHREI